MESNPPQQQIVLDEKTKNMIVKQLKDAGVIKGLTAEEVERIVENRVDLFAADRINMTDYALETAGAKIFYRGTSPNYRSGFWHWLSGTDTHSPTVIITVRFLHRSISSH